MKNYLKAIIPFLILFFVYSNVFAGQVIIYHQEKGKRKTISNRIKREYQQLSNQIDRDIWVFFYDKISTDIAAQTRTTRNQLGLGKPHQVIIVGVSYHPKKKLFIDYFINGSSNNQEGKALFNFVRSDFKANKPDLSTLPNHMHAILTEYLIALPAKKAKEEAKQLQLEKDRQAKEEEALLELKKTENIKREEVKKTEETKRTEVKKTEEVKRKLANEEASRTEVPIEIPWAPIGGGTGGLAMLLASAGLWRKRERYKTEKAKVLGKIKKQFDQFVTHASSTRTLLEFEVAPHLGVLSTTENQTDKSVVEMLSTKYYDYKHHDTYSEYDFNQHWFKEVIGTGVRFKPFKKQLGLAPLQESLHTLREDTNTITSISRKNTAFLKNIKQLDKQMTDVNQKQLLLVGIQSSIDTLHHMIAHCPIHYLPFEQAIQNAQDVLEESKVLIAQDNGIQEEVGIMEKALSQTNAHLHNFDALYERLSDYQEHIEKLKATFQQNQQEIERLTEAVKQWKQAFSYLPLLKETEQAIGTLEASLRELQAPVQKDWEGEHGLVVTMTELLNKMTALISSFEEFKAAKEQAPEQQQQIQVNHQTTENWQQQYPQLPQLDLTNAKVASNEAAMYTVQNSSHEPNWFEIRDLANTVLQLQTQLHQQFFLFQQAHHQYEAYQQQANNFAHLITEYEHSVGKWNPFAKEIKALEENMIGNQYFELVSTGKQLTTTQAKYLTFLKEQKDAKDKIPTINESILRLNHQAKRLSQSKYLFYEVQHLGLSLPTLQRNYVSHLKALRNVQAQLQHAIKQAQTAIRKQQQAEEDLRRYYQRFDSLSSDLRRLKRSRYAFGAFVSSPSWPHLSGTFIDQASQGKRALAKMQGAVNDLERHIARKKRQEREEEERKRREKRAKREERRRKERRNSNSSFGISSSSSRYNASKESSGFSGSFGDDDDW